MSKTRLLKYDKSLLKKEEQVIVEILSKVGEIVHSLWDKQYDEAKKQVFMFPVNATKEEILKAYEDDKTILNPYTVVKRNKDGSLYSVPYKTEYKNEIDKIVELLNETIVITKDHVLKEYLSELVTSYKTGDFDKAMEAYVKREDTKIALLMGPIEAYLDKVFGVKKAWQFNLRITVKDETKKMKQMMKLVKSKVLVKPLGSTAQAIETEKIKISVCDVIMFAGRQATSFTSSTNLPEDPKMVKKYGTKIVFYRNSMGEKFETMVKKYLKIVINTNNNDNEILEGYFNLIALHEIVEASIQYGGIRERLRGYADAVREFHAFLVGIKNAKYMALNGYFSEKQFNNIMLSYFLYGMDVLNRKDTNPSVIEYARGYAILFNYALLKGSFVITKEGVVQINPGIMNELTKLTGIVMEIYSNRNYQEVEKFFNAYCHFGFIDRIDFDKAS